MTKILIHMASIDSLLNSAVIAMYVYLQDSSIQAVIDTLRCPLSQVIKGFKVFIWESYLFVRIAGDDERSVYSMRDRSVLWTSSYRRLA